MSLYVGHVLIDRFKSMQRRNIIEPRIRQTVVFKYKHKVFTKRSHSEPKGLKVGNRNKDINASKQWDDACNVNDMVDISIKKIRRLHQF